MALIMPFAGIAIDENQKLDMTQCKFEHNNTGASIAGQLNGKHRIFPG